MPCGAPSEAGTPLGSFDVAESRDTGRSQILPRRTDQWKWCASLGADTGVGDRTSAAHLLPKLLPRNSLHRFCGRRKRSFRPGAAHKCLLRQAYLDRIFFSLSIAVKESRDFSGAGCTASLVSAQSLVTEITDLNRSEETMFTGWEPAAAGEGRFAKLALALMLWAEAVPAMNPSSAYSTPVTACRMRQPRHAAQLASLLPPATAHDILPA